MRFVSFEFHYRALRNSGSNNNATFACHLIQRTFPMKSTRRPKRADSTIHATHAIRKEKVGNGSETKYPKCYRLWRMKMFLEKIVRPQATFVQTSAVFQRCVGPKGTVRGRANEQISRNSPRQVAESRLAAGIASPLDLGSIKVENAPV